MSKYEIEDLPIVDGRIKVTDLLDWIEARDAGCAEYLAEELTNFLDHRTSLCKNEDKEDNK